MSSPCQSVNFFHLHIVFGVQSYQLWKTAVFSKGRFLYLAHFRKDFVQSDQNVFMYEFNVDEGNIASLFRLHTISKSIFEQR